MAKNVEQHATAPQELKALLIVGPNFSIKSQIIDQYKNPQDCLVIGDGTKELDINEIKTTLKEQNKIIRRRLDLCVHGYRYESDDGTSYHNTRLNKDITTTMDLVYELSKINEDSTGPECIHLWSCFGSTATNKVAIEYLSTMLKKKLILITHGEGKYSARGSLIQPTLLVSIKEYLTKNLTPYQQFIHDLPLSFEPSSFVQFEPGGIVTKFKTLRISKQATVATMINALVSMPKEDAASQKFVRSFLQAEGERFMQRFKRAVDPGTYAAMRNTLQDMGKSTEQRIKNVITGMLLHLINVTSEQDDQPKSDKQQENTKELMIKLLPILKSSGADLDNGILNTFPLIEAVRERNIEVVEALLQGGANATVKDNFGLTPLHEACSTGHVDIAKLLLKYKANPNETRLDGIVTPLHEACRKGHVDMAKLLLMAIYKQKQMAEADGQQLNNITAEINQGSVQIPCKLFKSSDTWKLEELIKTTPNSGLTIDKEQEVIHYQLLNKEEVQELQEVIAKRRAILDANVPNVNELPDKPSLQTEAKLAVENVKDKIFHVSKEEVGTEAQILPESTDKQITPPQPLKRALL